MCDLCFGGFVLWCGKRWQDPDEPRMAWGHLLVEIVSQICVALHDEVMDLVLCHLNAARRAQEAMKQMLGAGLRRSKASRNLGRHAEMPLR